MNLDRPMSRSVVGATALLVAFSLVGCNDDTQTASDSASSSPSAATAASEPAGTTPSADQPAPPTSGDEISAKDFLAVFQAALDQATSARITTKQSASKLTGEGIVDYQGDPLEMSMSVTIPAAGDKPLEMRLVDSVMYLKLPQLGGKFIAYDLNDPSNPLGNLADLFDPKSLMSAFADGIQTATYVGEEDVDGESMDHYAVVYDPSAVLGSADVPSASAVPMPDTARLDVYFDQDGFIRRGETDLGSLGTSTQTYNDWGTEVNVEAPPADQIMTTPGAPAS